MQAVLTILQIKLEPPQTVLGRLQTVLDKLGLEPLQTVLEPLQTVLELLQTVQGALQTPNSLSLSATTESENRELWFIRLATLLR